MTQIELKTASLIQQACRKFINASGSNGSEIDWEQRRYEIAKECFTMERSVTVREAVAWADQLIAELKKKKED